MIRLSTLIKVTLVGLVCNTAQAKAIVLGTLHYPPYVICDNNSNTVTGLDVNIMRRAFQQMKQPLIIRCLPWKRVLHLTATGAIDGAFPAYYTPQRSSWANFINTPLHYDSYAIATLRGKEFSVHNSQDITGKILVVGHGHFISKSFSAAQESRLITTVEAKNSDQALQILQRGSVDGYLDNVAVIDYTARRLGIAAKISILEQQLEQPKKSLVMLSKNSAQALQIQQLLEQALATMQRNQLIKALTDQYLNIPQLQPIEANAG